MESKRLKTTVKQLQSGDISVFDDIYYATKDVVYYTILSIMKDRSLAEDIMQDTYLTALEKIHQYKPKSTFTSWLLTIARNLSINEYNKRKREFQVDIGEQEYLFGVTESSSEKEILIHEMMSKLNDTERQIVVMHALADLKHREIAAIIDKPLGTVTYTYQQAIKKLQHMYRK